MDKYDQLFIRACKSKDADTRLRSVYRRFYGNYDDNHMRTCVNNRLARICEEYRLVTIPDLIGRMSPDYYIFGPARPYYEQVFDVLINAVAFAEVSKLPGYIPPARWRHIKNNHRLPLDLGHADNI